MPAKPYNPSWGTALGDSMVADTGSANGSDEVQQIIDDAGTEVVEAAGDPQGTVDAAGQPAVVKPDVRALQAALAATRKSLRAYKRGFWIAVGVGVAVSVVTGITAYSVGKKRGGYAGFEDGGLGDGDPLPPPIG